MSADLKKERANTAKAKTKAAKTKAVKTKAGKTSPGQSETIRIRLARSVIGSTAYQRAVVAGLGLRRLNQIVERKDTREIRGMVNKVSHLVQIIS